MVRHAVVAVHLSSGDDDQEKGEGVPDPGGPAQWRRGKEASAREGEKRPKYPSAYFFPADSIFYFAVLESFKHNQSFKSKVM